MTKFRVVADTNVIISSYRGSKQSPTKELRQRWEQDEFTLLYTLDILSEYVEKMLDSGTPRDSMKELVLNLQALGEYVDVSHFHERSYPTDSDDVAFVLCAINGDANYIVSYDRHLLDLAHRYEFTICRPIPFLQALRDSLNE